MKEYLKDKKNMALFVIAICCLLLFCVAGVYKYIQSRTPDFLGMTFYEAEKYAYEHNIVLRNGNMVDGKESDEGLIIKQLPVKGEKLSKDKIVIVNISRGLGKGRTPDVIGLTTAEAEKKIEEAGYKLGEVKQVEHSEEAGTVVEQTPKGDKETKKGVTINLEISDGTMTIVPYIIGEYYADAFNMLHNAELTTMSHAHQETFSNTIPEMYVVSQSIEAGTMVKKGTYVEFVISRGPEYDYYYDDDF